MIYTETEELIRHPEKDISGKSLHVELGQNYEEVDIPLFKEAHKLFANGAECRTEPGRYVTVFDFHEHGFRVSMTNSDLEFVSEVSGITLPLQARAHVIVEFLLSGMCPDEPIIEGGA